MKTEWLNGGQPFPEGHRKAGQVGMVIDFEDGRPEAQNVYAADPAALTLKLAAMYGNTNLRLAEVKATPAPATPPANPATPATPATPAQKPGRMTADERMQAAADLGDPEKAPAAIARLLAEHTGVDLVKQRQKEEEDATLRAREAETAKFLDEHPDWIGTAANAKLLRDRTFARVGLNFSAKDLDESYIELEEMGVLQTKSQEPTQPRTEEPLAPPPPPTRVSTGARPSSLGRQPGPVSRGGQQLTREYILSIAGSAEYERRLRDEPGFLAKVNAVLE